MSWSKASVQWIQYCLNVQIWLHTVVCLECILLSGTHTSRRDRCEFGTRQILGNVENSISESILKNYGSVNYVVFQQDKIRPHKAKSVSTYLLQKCIKVMCWAAQSLDINPSANACAFLKKRLRYHRPYPRNKSELFTVMQKEWLLIHDSYFTNLVGTMHTRASSVKMKKGGSTKSLFKYFEVFRKRSDPVTV